MGRPLGRIIFGGPDLPPRQLRDLLQEYVDRSPPGSRIDWATYYFRDRVLADALIRASDRGVQVRLVMEPHPRCAGASDAVITMLCAHGLNGGFHLYSAIERKGERGHLHSKIYAFSEPDIAWVGSFNPSCNEPDDQKIIAEIGDQDRGHNLLLGIERPKLTAALRDEVSRLIAPARLPLKLRLSSYWRVKDDDTKLYFYPRTATLIVEPLVAMLGKSATFRGAISHLKKGPLSKAMLLAARRGASIDLLVHDTERRVRSKLLDKLRDAGIRIRRVFNSESLPMHAKFLLLGRGERKSAWLGSYNFNRKSRMLNAEVLVRTTNQAVIDALSQRFSQISALANDDEA